MRLKACARTLSLSLSLSLSFAFLLYHRTIWESAFKCVTYRILTRGMISRARLRNVVRRECNSSPSQDSRDAPASLSQLAYKTSGNELTTPLKREVLDMRCPRFTLVPIGRRCCEISDRCWQLARYYEQRKKRGKEKNLEVYRNFKSCYLSTVIKYAVRYKLINQLYQSWGLLDIFKEFSVNIKNLIIK